MALSSLAVKLGFTVDQSQLKTSMKGVNQLEDSVKQLQRTALKASAALAGVFGLGAINNVINKGADAANLGKALGLDADSVRRYEFAAKKLGGSITGTLAGIRGEIDASFEGGASDAFYRFIGGDVSSVEDAVSRIFDSIQGKGALEQRNILSQLGISGTDQNPFLEGRGAFEDAVKSFSGTSNAEISDLKAIRNALDKVLIEIETGIIKVLSDNSTKIFSLLEGLSDSIGKLVSVVADNLKFIVSVLGGMKLVQKTVEADRKRKKANEVDVEAKQGKNVGLRTNSLLQSILNINTQILNQIRADDILDGDGSRKKGKKGKKGRSNGTGGRPPKAKGGITPKAKGGITAEDVADMKIERKAVRASRLSRLLSPANVVAALAMYFVSEYGSKGGPLSAGNLFGENERTDFLDKPLGEFDWYKKMFGGEAQDTTSKASGFAPIDPTKAQQQSPIPSTADAYSAYASQLMSGQLNPSGKIDVDVNVSASDEFKAKATVNRSRAASSDQ